jgi:N-acyl-D-aspartate/D-glutamate deacylase
VTPLSALGQGMMGQQLRNDAGAVIPAWMHEGGMVYPWTDTYEPTAETMVPAIAARTGQSPLEVCWELLMDTAGPHAGVLWRPLFDYKGNNDDVVQAFELENVIPGFDDAGAHCTILTDATCATTNVSYYGKDRTGPGPPGAVKRP